ncbi:insecticidal toxin complex [Fusarium coicis]|nr:insecticidal toxin complex [Fusarium coicis]
MTSSQQISSVFPSTTQQQSHDPSSQAGPSHRQGNLNTASASEPSYQSNIKGTSVQSIPRVTSLFDSSQSTGQGGGALRDIDQRFKTNPCNGTFSLAIPIEVSNSRNGAQPTLSLSYDSGSGSGAFGIGWDLNVGSVTRNTAKRMPTYDDEIDTFVLSSADELVPDAKTPPRILEGYVVATFLPRVRSEVSIIERWSSITDPGDVYWRTISSSNIVCIFGRTDESRVFDSGSDGSGRKRIFSWLLCEWYDTVGNSIVYIYKAENGDGVMADDSPTNLCELGRDDITRSRARYPKSIRYGNKKPSRDSEAWNIIPQSKNTTDWMFEVVFDYGEHDLNIPTTAETVSWTVRPDPCSRCKSGFDIRTYRLCRRILMFHNFPAELGLKDYLVSSHVLEYNTAATGSFLASIINQGHIWDGSKYVTQQTPPCFFDYSQLGDMSSVQLKSAKPRDLKGLLGALPESKTQWLDLDGEGMPGLLVRRNGGWYYQKNWMPLQSDEGDEVVQKAVDEEGSDEGCHDGSQTSSDMSQEDFGAIIPIKSIPNHMLYQPTYFEDLDGNGLLDLVASDHEGRLTGYQERTDDGDWTPFTDFQSIPNINIHSEKTTKLDLTGDGLDDVVNTDYEAGDEIIWYESKGKAGFAAPKRKATGVANLPLNFTSTDPSTLTVLADMSGDGLRDIVVITSARISYWPNLGYGTFGQEILMYNPPIFSDHGIFDLQRICLMDLDGSGTTDLVYLPEKGGVVCYRNLVGNGWSAGIAVPSFPVVQDPGDVFALDLLGKGSSCLCYVGTDGASSDELLVWYLDMTGPSKPNLLRSFSNGSGSVTTISYCPSTKFSLRDERKGNPWKTKLPFPVHVVSRVATQDIITETCSSTRYAYHEGYFDGREREFCGFGMVEEWKTEIFKLNNGNQYRKPTRLTRSWFHNGSPDLPLTPEGGYGEPRLASRFPSDLSYEDRMEACRALRSTTLRYEIYGEDKSHQSEIPYLVVENASDASLVQEWASPGHHAVFDVQHRETCTLHYERVVSDVRIEHEMVLSRNMYGDIMSSLQVSYGRDSGSLSTSGVQPMALAQQTANSIRCSTVEYTDSAIKDDHVFYKPVITDVAEYIVLGMPVNGILDFDQMKETSFATLPRLSVAMTEDLTSLGSSGSKVLLPTKRRRAYYRSGDLNRQLEHHKFEAFGVVDQTFDLVMDQSLRDQVYGANETLKGASEQAYMQDGHVDLDNDGNWWAPSSRTYFGVPQEATSSSQLTAARESFFTPTWTVDPFNFRATVKSDNHYLLPLQLTDAVANLTSFENDYRCLQAQTVTDPNQNRTQILRDALGRSAATARMGKKDESVGDSLEGLPAVVDSAIIQAFWANPTEAVARDLLGQAGTYTLYHDCASGTRSTSSPLLPELLSSELQFAQSLTIQLSRSEHVMGRGANAEPADITMVVNYFDGASRLLQSATLTSWEAGSDKSTRWSFSGSKIYDEAQNTIQAAWPFFGDSHLPQKHQSIRSLSTLNFIDAIGRSIGTLNPDHSWSKIKFEPWTIYTFDAGDLIKGPGLLADEDLGFHAKSLSESLYLPSFYDRAALGTNQNAQLAAEKSLVYAGCGTLNYLNAQGAVVQTSRKATCVKDDRHWVFCYNPRGDKVKEVDPLGRTIQQCTYDLSGHAVLRNTMDSESAAVLFDCFGNPVVSWESNGCLRLTQYDGLRRETEVKVVDNNKAGYVWSRIEYGDNEAYEARALALNQRNRVVKVWDQSGVRTKDLYDFKGNCIKSTVEHTTTYHSSFDATPDMPLDGELFVIMSEYDALDREKSSTDALGRITRRKYNLGGGLVEVSTSSDGQEWVPHISSIQYDADGLTAVVEHGNSTRTSYTYGDLDRRLARKKCLRKDGAVLEDISYVYDCLGRTVSTKDAAQQEISFRNMKVDSSSNYTYDTHGRLVAATGREMLSSADDPWFSSRSDSLHRQLIADGSQMTRYTETYEYDKADNILKKTHRTEDRSAPDWIMSYGYKAIATSNLLEFTRVGKKTETYGHDESGCMTSMSGFSKLEWDGHHRLRASSQQRVTSESVTTGETTWYIYNSSGERVRKITDRLQTADMSAPSKLKETIYIGDCEIQRAFEGDGLTARTEIRTSQITESSRSASPLVSIEETNSGGSGSAGGVTNELLRYRMSANLELDDTGRVVSYEEYTPFGTTTIQLSGSSIEAPRAYRYSSYRHDSETSLYFCQARYYAPWIGRWTSPDPKDTADGMNVYCYVANDPINYVDPEGTVKTTPELGIGGVGGYAVAMTFVSLQEGKKGFETSDTRTTDKVAKDEEASQIGVMEDLEGKTNTVTKTNDDAIKQGDPNKIINRLKKDKAKLTKEKAALEKEEHRIVKDKAKQLAKLNAERKTIEKLEKKALKEAVQTEKRKRQLSNERRKNSSLETKTKVASMGFKLFKCFFK